MAPEQEQFQQLRRLLALKRHEQPPPGYFDGFSRQVILRLRAGERVSDASDFQILSWEAPWLRRVLAFLQNRPAVAGGFGFAVCGLMLAGLLFSEANSAPVSPFGTSVAAVPAPMRVESRFSEPANPFVRRVSVSPAPVRDVVVPGQVRDSLFQQLKQVQPPDQITLLSSPQLR